MRPFWLLSWTWGLANLLKPDDKNGRARVIRRLNWTYFGIALGVLTIATVLTGNRLTSIQPHGFRWWAVLLQYVLMWRFFEVFYAFYRDAFDKLSQLTSSSSLDWAERVGLALRSYVELIIDFAFVFALLPASAWAANDKPPPPKSVTDVVWYSANVITTSGGGGFLPASIPLKALSLCELFCGVILLVVCFTIYTSRALGGRPTEGGA